MACGRPGVGARPSHRRCARGATASNAVVTISTGAGTIRITATGINSDQIIGTGLASGLVMTLASPGNMTSGDSFRVAQNASLQFQVGANANQTIVTVFLALAVETNIFLKKTFIL